MKTPVKVLAATALLGTGFVAGGALNAGGIGAFATEATGMQRAHWRGGHHKGWRKGKRRGGMKRMLRRLKRMDTDGNGEVSREEFIAQAEKRFAKLDANNDTVLNGDELIARKKARQEWRLKRRIRRLDTNNDGAVTKDEVEAQVRERFSYRDLDDDGKITKSDMPPRWRGKRDGAGRDDAGEDDGASEANEERRGRRGGWGRRKGPKTIEEAMARAERRFSRMDANGDGTVTFEELTERRQDKNAFRMKRRMKRLDQDRDGSVTRDEFLSVRAERFRRWDLDDSGAISADDLPPGIAERWQEK